MRKRTILLATALTTALTTGLLTALPATTATAAPAAGPTADFNGDGYGDVAFAAPYAKVDGQGMAGYVAVVYGGATGLDPAKHTVISQNTAGVPGAAEAEDSFGEAIARADLNGDGYSDLAVGSPGEDVGDDVDGGSVTVLWGSASGLKNGTTVKDPAVSGHDNWGTLLTTGDFDGDGKQDLAASAYANPYVVRGPLTPTGTTGAVKRVALPEASYSVDAMAAGDTNDDGRSDLALTYRVRLNDDETGSWSKGAAYLGTATGLDTSLPRPLNGGTTLAFGDIDGDGNDEIAIGNVFSKEDDHSGSLGGRVVVIRGSEGGPVNGDAPMAELTQDSEGVPGADEANDGFGSALSIGDTDGDGYGDLAIGVVFEDVGTVENTGATILMNGSASGVSRTGARTFTQDTAGVPGSAEASDYFGSDVLLADVGKDGHPDFAVTAGFEDEGIGAITALRGSATGPVTDGARTFGPGSLGRTRSYGAFGAGLIG
ncbi:FG-GAP-like repeat-containing protein [Streptomyces massasporeus]|uniref:FG-GAP-like repeat-containing protein n=1 Tax=Streptomyces massasporeus TaxID=67324 RepID=UPI0036B40615